MNTRIKVRVFEITMTDLMEINYFYHNYLSLLGWLFWHLDEHSKLSVTLWHHNSVLVVLCRGLEFKCPLHKSRLFIWHWTFWASHCMLCMYNTQYQRVNTKVFLALALVLHSHFKNRQFVVDMLKPPDQFVRPAQISNNRIVIFYQMSCEM